MHCLQKGPYFKDLVLNKDLFGILGPYWVLIYIPGSLFSLHWVHSRKECQFSLIFAGIGSGLQCQQILIVTYAYALIFIHCCFGSLFWPLGVLIGSLFHKKMGPHLKAWGSLLVLEAVETPLEILHTYQVNMSDGCSLFILVYSHYSGLDDD